MAKLLRARKNDVSWSTEPEPWNSAPSDDFILDYVEQQISDDLKAQPIIEVTELELKKALKEFLMRDNATIELLYQAHDNYTKKYFHSKLSEPFITLERMSHKTLGKYRAGKDPLGLENHITLNRDFVALNSESRILEELKHQMIHQYQDEILYEKHNDKGELIHPGEKRPKDWHNKDFKAMAKILGIEASGPKCYGSPAKMPEVKSYNRKFSCGCTASNGYPVTIWSTREIKAVCQVCNKPFAEVKKSGDTIHVESSDVEKVGEDAIELRMRKEFKNFERFTDKLSMSVRLKEIQKARTRYKDGIYQKGHNAHLRGYNYWVAYNTPKLSSEVKARGNTRRSERPKRGVVRHD